ncbi:LuxR C-terminal-related transcriptional regulator [Agrococcus sp. Ld7]|uniref:LuxR C-terminal-related transcriptional regulator n=1 Tax=Agrococcus sp. Ld7 TaxID=649148 RepID=UPI00386D586C
MADRAARIEAGRRCGASGDWEGALAHLRAAHELAPLDADDLCTMAQAAWMAGRLAESIPLSEDAYRQLRESGSHTHAAMAALRLSLLWFTRGEVTLGTAWQGRARRVLAQLPDGPAHAYLAYLDAAASALEGSPESAREHVERIGDLARRFPEPAVEALSLAVAGMAAVRLGETKQGFALLDEAMLPVIAEAVPAEWAGDIYCTIIHLCHQLADFRRMAEWTEATERWCSRFRSESIYSGVCRVHRLELRWAHGDWQGAEQLVERESGALADGEPWVAGEGFYQLGEMRRVRGDVDGARRAYRQASETGIDPQPGAALLELDVGNLPGAARMIDVALAEHGGIARIRLLRAATEVALAGGAIDAAELYAQELVASADLHDTDGFRAWSLHAVGMVALARGDAEQALAALRRAHHAFQQTQQPFECARVLALLARGHELLGDAERAASARDRAAQLLRDLGVTAGSASAHETRAGPLTAREAEVLARVALGESNRDVADALVISEKTVGRHLANVYLKLDVGSRTAAAAWWHAHAGAADAVP